MIIDIRTQLEESDAFFENRQAFVSETVELEDHLFEIKWLIKALPFFDISLDPMNREKLKSLVEYIVVQMYPEDLQVCFNEVFETKIEPRSFPTASAFLWQKLLKHNTREEMTL